MPRKLLFILLISCFSLTACLESPVTYKEKSYPISKSNIKEYCTQLEVAIPNYSCTQYFQETFELQKEHEKISVDLNKTNLRLIYECDEGKNEELYELYSDLLEQL